MQLSRFWSSVGSVAALLFGVGLLQLILVQVVTLFGLLPGAGPMGAGLGLVSTQSGSLAFWLVALVAVVVPVWGTITYLDWRWSWKPVHIGAAWTGHSGGWLGVGLIAGFGTALAAALVSGLLAGDLSASLAFELRLNQSLALIPALLAAPGIELVYRGAVLARYQSDLEGWHVPVAAALTPFAWMLVNRFFGLGAPEAGIWLPWMGAMSVAFTLLVLRTGSLWLTIGLRVGVMASLLFISPSADGALLIWGPIAVILIILEWQREQRRPRRMGPRGGTRRRVIHMGNFRDPYGPH